MKKLFLIIQVLSLNFLLLACLNPSSSEAEFGKYKLAFVGIDSEGNYNINSINGDGTDYTSLYSTTQQITELQWSKVGTMGFIQQDSNSDNSRVYLYVNSVEQPRQITSQEATYKYLSWYTNSSFIGFESDLTGYSDIYRVRLLDYNMDPLPQYELENLTESEITDTYPVYSPDVYSRRIAFVIQHNGTMDLATINPWTKSIVNLTNGEFEYLGKPSWAPDSDQLVFSGQRDNQENKQIFTIISDGSGLNQLTGGSNDSHSPVWAPEGDWIAYKSGGELRVVTSSGEYDRSLSACDSNTGGIAWSPDGRVLAYILNSKIHMIDLYSSVFEQVTDDDMNQSELLPVFSLDVR
ncbi:MAG: hypothetical protein GF372_03925 [Candidatus Marinimicrobia bacterium]|nr:hypothetical protein [Candidatus Neomarinimicrobiota bacterium]